MSDRNTPRSVRELAYRVADPSILGVIELWDEPMSYLSAWDLQSRLHRERLANGIPDTVLILEHRPVYTLGRSTHPSHWGGDDESLRQSGCEVCHVNRGGSATYHGPGQIVVYPILRLAQHASGPKRLVWLLEEAIIRVLQRWHIQGHRIDKLPGVWVRTPETAKIASIGIRIQQGVTLHGFALNVDMDLSPFRRIQPCGLADGRMTSMCVALGSALDVNEVKRHVADVWNEVFDVQWPIAVGTRGTPPWGMSGYSASPEELGEDVCKN